MRDEQVRRYARHILLPDVGGLGQTALMVSTAIVDLRTSDPAALVAARYLSAGGVGTILLRGATRSQLADLAAYGPDTKLVAVEGNDELPPEARAVLLPGKPGWWPSTIGDDAALAYWRGGIAATTWMADIANK